MLKWQWFTCCGFQNGMLHNYIFLYQASAYYNLALLISVGINEIKSSLYCHNYVGEASQAYCVYCISRVYIAYKWVGAQVTSTEVKINQ